MLEVASLEVWAQAVQDPYYVEVIRAGRAEVLPG